MTRIYVEPEPGTASDGTIHVPRGPLLAAAALVLLVFGLAITARTTGLGAAREPVALPAVERSIRFVPTSEGQLAVYDATSGLQVIQLAPEGNGFLFGALRGLAYKRTVARADPSAPYRLTRWQDGRITLDDPLTSMHISVNSFGPTQIASFEQLFTPPSAP